jgi:hypothetical protein
MSRPHQHTPVLRRPLRPSPPRFELPKALRSWWDGVTATHQAVTEVLERGLRWIALPCLPRDADANLDAAARQLARPLTVAVLRKLAQRFKREARRGPDAVVRADKQYTLDVIILAMHEAYDRLLENRDGHPRDSLNTRVERLCRQPIVLPKKQGHRSRYMGPGYEWSLIAMEDLVRERMRRCFPGHQWSAIGKLDATKRFALLQGEWPDLPETVLTEANLENYRSEAARVITSALTLASRDTIRRARLRHQGRVRRLDEAYGLGTEK